MGDRRDELAAAARKRLLEPERDDPSATEAEETKAEESEPMGKQVMYRGQVVRKPGGSSPRMSTTEAEVRVGIEKLKQLYHDGLISRSEAEERRAELLKRLNE